MNQESERFIYTQPKRPSVRVSTFVERETTGSNALKVLNSLESPIKFGLKTIARRNGCPTSKFVEPATSGDIALKLARTMENPIAAGLRDGGKNRKDL